MEIYRGDIELLDYVFYATVERGKVYETGSFIHNYALAYALGLVRGETYVYARQVQEPHYLEELTPLNGRSLHDARAGHPGQPPAGAVEHAAEKPTPFRASRRRWATPTGALPACCDRGPAFVFTYLCRCRPTSLEAPALADLLSGRPARVRLGKFLGKARLRLQRAGSVGQGSGPFQSEALLNWRDLEANPVVCDILAASLPTRLISRAQFDGGNYYEARFGEDTVRLPADMRFLARAPQPTGRQRRR